LGGPESCPFLSGARPGPGGAALFSRCFHSGLRRDLAECVPENTRSAPLAASVLFGGGCRTGSGRAAAGGLRTDPHFELLHGCGRDGRKGPAERRAVRAFGENGGRKPDLF